MHYPRGWDGVMVVLGFTVDLPGLEFASLNLNLTGDRSQSAPLNLSEQLTTELHIAEYYSKNDFSHLFRRQTWP